MSWKLAGDDAAFLHQRFAGQESALTVLVIDERKPSRVGGGRFITPACKKSADD